MIESVAIALGDDLLRGVVFVGGCTTGLLITDEFIKEEIRYTNDVDLIVDVISYAKWADFQDKLRTKGFRESAEDDVNCRMRLGELKVDFMPDDEKILGYSNRWYSDGIASAQDYQLTDDLVIRILEPLYFVATKFEAYIGRGNNDPLSSHDLEDILNLVDGREELVDEVLAAHQNVRQYIAEQIKQLLNHKDVDYAVQGIVRGNSARGDLIFKRLESMVAL